MGVRTMSFEDAKLMMDYRNDIVVVDVRTSGEYRQGHIRNSMLIPVDVLKNEAQYKLKDKGQNILVYCKNGTRSRMAVDILNGLGYKSVYSFGGIIDWPYELVK